MLCHYCREPAVSQCLICQQYYCAQHGRGICVGCAEVGHQTPSAPTPAAPAALNWSPRPSRRRRRLLYAALVIVSLAAAAILLLTQLNAP